MKMSNKVYDVLKWIALIAFPALIALYSTLSGIWGWPYGEQIVGTLAALEIFLGTILQISNAKYKKTA
jgi:hypothetical protein